MGTPTLDATSGGADANSYTTLDDASTYHYTHLYASDWDSATEHTRTVALIMATRVLDEHVKWGSSRVTSTQALEWPRVDIIGKDGLIISSTTIITDLKNATAEMARHLIIKDRTVEQASRELKNLQADVVKLEFNPTYRAPVIPPSVWEIIKFYGTLRTTPGQARLVRA